MKSTLVEDVMSRGLVTARESASAKELAKQMHEHSIGAIPIVDAEGRLEGIVSQRDLLERAAGAFTGTATEIHARDLMSRDVVFVRVGASLRATTAKLLEANVRRLPVLDDEDRLVGVVSRGDLLQPVVRDDEEIEREICREILVPMPWVNCDAIEVEVSEGEVTLAGTVDRRSDVSLLVQLVERLDGVLAVRDKIGYAVDDAPAAEPQHAGSEAERPWDDGWGE